MCIHCHHPSPEFFILQAETLYPLTCNSCVSYMQHRMKSCLFCFLIYSANLCLLIKECNPFTFKVIPNTEGFSVILLFVFYKPYSFFSLHFLYYYLLLCLVDFFLIVKCLNYFLISIYVYSLAVFSVVTTECTLIS